MDCEKCLEKCKAGCCGVVPFTRDFINSHKTIRPVKEEIFLSEDKNLVVMMTEDFYCPYLGLDLKCSVYNDRTDVCKKYGDESHPLMTCEYQDKNGIMRSRPERRRIKKIHQKIL